MSARIEDRCPELRHARQHLAQFDRRRDEHEQQRRVRHLTAVGESAQDIAVVVRASDRNVVRIRGREDAPDRPPLPDPAVTDQRAQQLEQTADLALHLSVLLRDEDPNLVWNCLTRLSRRQLQELAVTALAAIPVDGWTPGELYGWVTDLGDHQ